MNVLLRVEQETKMFILCLVSQGEPGPDGAAGIPGLPGEDGAVGPKVGL